MSTSLDQERITRLLSRAQQGDQEVFEQLFDERTRQRWLVAIATALPAHIRAKVDPEDILQEALHKAAKSIADLREAHTPGFHRWMLHIIYGTLSDTLRGYDRQSRQVKREEDYHRDPNSSVYEVQGSPHTPLARTEQWSQIAWALDQLKPTYRRVVIHRILEAYSTKETAELLSMNVDNVSKTLGRALTKLKCVLEDNNIHTTVFRPL